MDRAERLLIEAELWRLVVDYCHLVDHGHAAGIADLFTEDGVWMSPERTMTGRAEIATAFRQRQANAARISRHVCSNMKATIHGSDTAEAVTYLTLYRHDPRPPKPVAPTAAPTLVGEYQDSFVRTADGWRFSRREVRVSFA